MSDGRGAGPERIPVHINYFMGQHYWVLIQTNWVKITFKGQEEI